MDATTPDNIDPLAPSRPPSPAPPGAWPESQIDCSREAVDKTDSTVHNPDESSVQHVDRVLSFHKRLSLAFLSPLSPPDARSYHIPSFLPFTGSPTDSSLPSASSTTSTGASILRSDESTHYMTLDLHRATSRSSSALPDMSVSSMYTSDSNSPKSAQTPIKARAKFIQGHALSRPSLTIQTQMPPISPPASKGSYVVSNRQYRPASSHSHSFISFSPSPTPSVIYHDDAEQPSPVSPSSPMAFASPTSSQFALSLQTPLSLSDASFQFPPSPSAHFIAPSVPVSSSGHAFHSRIIDRPQPNRRASSFVPASPLLHTLYATNATTDASTTVSDLLSESPVTAQLRSSPKGSRREFELYLGDVGLGVRLEDTEDTEDTEWQNSRGQELEADVNMAIGGRNAPMAAGSQTVNQVYADATIFGTGTHERQPHPRQSGQTNNAVDRSLMSLSVSSEFEMQGTTRSSVADDDAIIPVLPSAFPRQVRGPRKHAIKRLQEMGKEVKIMFNALFKGKERVKMERIKEPHPIEGRRINGPPPTALSRPSSRARLPLTLYTFTTLRSRVRGVNTQERTQTVSQAQNDIQYEDALNRSTSINHNHHDKSTISTTPTHTGKQKINPELQTLEPLTSISVQSSAPALVPLSIRDASTSYLPPSPETSRSLCPLSPDPQAISHINIVDSGIRVTPSKRDEDPFSLLGLTETILDASSWSREAPDTTFEHASCHPRSVETDNIQIFQGTTSGSDPLTESHASAPRVPLLLDEASKIMDHSEDSSTKGSAKVPRKVQRKSVQFESISSSADIKYPAFGPLLLPSNQAKRLSLPVVPNLRIPGGSSHNDEEMPADRL